MGLERTKVYLDSCLAIYLVEENQPFATQVENLHSKVGIVDFVISDLTKMECLILPFRRSDSSLVEKFEGWFEQLELVPITGSVFLEAARLRANNPSLKTPDAIHLAAAKHFGCDEFWINDDRLGKASPITLRNIT